MSPQPRSNLDRFLDHVGALPATPEACWLWAGRMHPWGYGTFWWRDGVNAGRSLNAHRASYLLLVGTIPPGLHIDHLCRNRACVNPAHLEAITRRENILRGEGLAARNARATHCKRGHRFTTENTITRKNGARLCRTLMDARQRTEASGSSGTSRGVLRQRGSRVSALTKPEYRSALRADHGTVRRFLAGCRCRLCDRPAHHRFKAARRAAQ